MKKKLLFLIVVVCAFLMLGSVSVFAADTEAVFNAELPVGLASSPSEVSPSDAGYFPDVAPKFWYYNYIEFTAANDLFNGYPDGTFRPDREMTRAEVARVLYAMEKEPEVTFQSAFLDVTAGDWFADAVEWAASVGVVAGYTDGRFGPDDKITRQDFVAMLYRYGQMKKYDVSASKELTLPDSGDVADYAETAFKWAMAEDIITGNKEGDSVYLRPKNNTTRAQVAKMLSVFAVNYMNLGAVDKVEFLADSYSVTVGNSVLIIDGHLAVSPKTAYAEMTWTSSDESVAKVSRGVITGVAPGNATITCTAFNGKTASLAVTVTATPADPYQDVVDYLRLHGTVNGADELDYIIVDSWEQWKLRFGITLDTASDAIAFISDSYNNEDLYGIYTMMVPNPKTKECECQIILEDDYEAVFWVGKATLNTGAFMKIDGIPLDSFECSEPAMASTEMKDLLSEYLEDDVHFILGELNGLFEDMGLKVTIKDFGFTNY
ncbi:MAG: S-layer homology domain-containing protein [Clostridia bacterium]